MVPWPTTCKHTGFQPSALWQKLSEELHVAIRGGCMSSREQIVCQENSLAEVSILLVYHKTQSALGKSHGVFVLYLGKPDMLQRVRLQAGLGITTSLPHPCSVLFLPFLPYHSPNISVAVHSLFLLRCPKTNNELF